MFYIPVSALLCQCCSRCSRSVPEYLVFFGRSPQRSFFLFFFFRCLCLHVPSTVFSSFRTGLILALFCSPLFLLLFLLLRVFSVLSLGLVSSMFYVDSYATGFLLTMLGMDFVFFFSDVLLCHSPPAPTTSCTTPGFSSFSARGSLVLSLHSIARGLPFFLGSDGGAGETLPLLGCSLFCPLPLQSTGFPAAQKTRSSCSASLLGPPFFSCSSPEDVFSPKWVDSRFLQPRSLFDSTADIWHIPLYPSASISYRI